MSEPSADLARLDRLVGTWRASGGTGGTVTYEWMEGRHFLLQRVALEQDGQTITGLEVIGHEHKYGEEPSTDIKSRFYGSEGGTLDYVYEIVDDKLTIWMGERGSPAYYAGTFTDDDTITGAWVYPGGGGYDAIMSRVKED